ncbi:MAG: CotH kinase family protein [Ruminiclostridium sp.]|nr:CotH kinase family protein [Ruminiclostridium sp.]
MSTHKHVDMICLALCLGIILVVSGLLIWQYPQARTEPAGEEPDYAQGLFSTDSVHTIDIAMEDWDAFLETCENEEYTMCTVTIDGEQVENIAIRAKGNTSLSSVKTYGNDRYSFKLEFDHYQEGGNFQGLDKLSLNNCIQDNTYMKDYLTYQLMNDFGMASPLCSYAWITVNGEDWGLYLAVEGVEESFLDRNYGSVQGELYKPDSMDMGGGRGFGGDFQMPEEFSFEDMEGMEGPENFDPSTMEMPEGMEPPAGGQMSQRGEMPNMGGFGGMGSDDVKLVYTDDSFDSYANIFNNPKTGITDADKTRLIQSLKTLNEGTDIESVVDVEGVIRYFVVHNFVCNGDSYTGSMVHNYYLYEEDGVLSMIPWDYNLAFGGFRSGGDATSLVNTSIDEPVSGGTVEDRPMLAWIFRHEEYTARYHQYVADFLTYFTSGEFEAEFDRVAEMIAPYVEKDPTKFCTYEEFRTGVDTLREFCLLRAESIQGQLAGSTEQVDASHLTLSDMGSMGMGGGMGGPGGEMPDFEGEMPTPSTGGNGSPPNGRGGGGMPQAPPEVWSGGPPSFG